MAANRERMNGSIVVNQFWKNWESSEREIGIILAKYGGNPA